MAKKNKKNNKFDMSSDSEMTNKKEKGNNKEKKHPDVNGVMEFAEELNPDDFE